MYNKRPLVYSQRNPIETDNGPHPTSRSRILEVLWQRIKTSKTMKFVCLLYFSTSQPPSHMPKWSSLSHGILPTGILNASEHTLRSKPNQIPENIKQPHPDPDQHTVKVSVSLWNSDLNLVSTSYTIQSTPKSLPNGMTFACLMRLFYEKTSASSPNVNEIVSQ